MIDKIVESVETALENLEGNISIEKKKISESQSSTESKQPYPSIRYPFSDSMIMNEESVEEESKKAETIPETPKITVERKEEKERIEEIHSKEEELVLVQNEKEEDISENQETYFIDIGKEVRLIHLFGPPSGGKTTLALQSAIEILPRETFYVITSHATSILKRIKQMTLDERWKDYPDLKQRFFPIQTQNLLDLQSQIERIINFSSQEIGLIVIDHFTDYIRGETHKEENRDILRRILEDLYLLSNKKKCKILIINGFAYKGSAPAEDLVESFCDMTIKISNDRKNFEVQINDEKICSCRINNSGFENIYLNIYF